MYDKNSTYHALSKKKEIVKQLAAHFCVREKVFQFSVHLKCQIYKLLRKREFALFLCFFSPATYLFLFNIHEKITISIYNGWNEFYESPYARTFLISFTQTREAPNIYCINKVLKHNKENDANFHKWFSQ